MKKTLPSLYLVVFAFSIINVQCNKDWLDKKPEKNLSTPSTLNDLEAMLDSEVLYVSPLRLGSIAADEISYLDANFPALPNHRKIVYIWKQDFPNNNNFDWGNTYAAILVTNIVLEQLSEIEQTSDNLRQYQRIKGNALFQRARLFFEASQIWAPPYNPLTASTDLGIPMRLESNINIPSRRSTVHDSYLQISEDLVSALSLVPERPLYKNRASKAAVYGQLARYFLTVEDYKKAGAYADSVLQINSSLIDFNTLPIVSTFIGAFNNNPEVIFHSNDLGGGVTRLNPMLYLLYDTLDLRRQLFFTKNANGSLTFKGNYFNEIGAFFTGLATDEMYLIRAETNARIGKIDDAMKDLNILLKTRYKRSSNGQTTYIDKSASDETTALNYILEERKKELVLRGQRWSDLRRLNNDDRFSTVINHTVLGNNYELVPKDSKYVLPIPDDVIQYSRIEQNPGWN